MYLALSLTGFPLELDCLKKLDDGATRQRKQFDNAFSRMPLVMESHGI